MFELIYDELRKFINSLGLAESNSIGGVKILLFCLVMGKFNMI